MALLPVVAIAAVVLAGCAGNTNPGATKITDTTATLRANVLCGSGETCDGYFRWRIHPNGAWVNGAHVGPVNGPLTVNPLTWRAPAGTFSPATTYDYQWCGRGSSGSGYMCFGPTDQQPSAGVDDPGNPNTSTAFTTLPATNVKAASAQQFADSV